MGYHVVDIAHAVQHLPSVSDPPKISCLLARSSAVVVDGSVDDSLVLLEHFLVAMQR